MNNMDIYNKLRTVPNEAKRVITGGRLNGFTDVNPMWRIKALTETFGPCGFGWWYKITDKRLEGSGDEIRAFVDIELYYKLDGEVSQPIPGTGGSSFLTNEKNGAYTSDECYKMALTDAISVAAKALGVAADVYYERDRDKYTNVENQKETVRQGDNAQRTQQAQAVQQTQANESDDGKHCSVCGAKISDKVFKFSSERYKKPLCMDCQNKAKKNFNEI